MSDPLIWPLYYALERNDSTGAFLALFKQAKEGQLRDHQVFMDLCTVLSEQLRRANSDNSQLKHGIRYPRDYLNFMTVMRSYGHKSAQQYGILISQLGGPSPRTLR